MKFLTGKKTALNASEQGRLAHASVTISGPSIKRSTSILAAMLFVAVAFEAHAQVQIPPEIEVQAQAIDDRFQAVLAQECTNQICSPIGCEVIRFQTLDEAQNSSLPGLDMSDELAAAPLQFKLRAMRCEFAYEPSLSADAVSALRQRISTKVRQSGVSLAITGRKLSAASPAVKAAADETAVTPQTPPSFFSHFAPALPQALLIFLGTLAILSIIWGFRRLGKPKPLMAVAEPMTTDGAAISPADEEPSALALMTKREYLQQVFDADANLASNALAPLTEKKRSR